MASIRNGLCVWLVLGLILGVHRGYIALWQDQDPQPCQVFPYKASLLPQEEQARLEAGIQVRDADHLKELLMDYLS